MSTREISELILNNPRSIKKIYTQFKYIIDEIYPEIEDVTEKLYMIKVDMYNPPLCRCGKKKKFYRFSSGFHSTCGSTECKSQAKKINTEITNKEKYGVKCVFLNEKIKEKIKKTNLEKTGYINNLSNPEKREKAKKTMLERYGVDVPLKIEKSKKKRRDTMIENYGSHSWLYSDRWKSKMEECYGSINPMQNNVIKERAFENQRKNKLKKLIEKIEKTNKVFIKSEKDRIFLKCEKCQHQFNINRNVLNSYLRSNIDCCEKCNYSERFRSKKEIELYQFCIEEFKDFSISSNRKFKNYEVDVFIEELDLAIEFNGLYWHSERKKDKNYHIKKTQFFSDLGINLIHIWEDDWFFKKDIVKSIIKSKIKPKKIGARKLKIKSIESNIAKVFHEENHIDGYAIASFHVALFQGDEIISVISFGKPRFKKYGEWEIVRYTVKGEYSIIGGFSKLLKFFEKEKKPKSLITYKKLDLGVTNIYENLGFEKIKRIEPNYFWIIDDMRINRMNFMKNRLPIKNSKMTEIEYMHSQGHFRIWDSGSDLFIKKY